MIMHVFILFAGAVQLTRWIVAVIDHFEHRA